MTNHHLDAWQHVQPHLFGEVIEITRKKPWGFQQDRPDIINLTVDEFLANPRRTDTILLHILSGEGESADKLAKLLSLINNYCVQCVILEHNPAEWINLRSMDWFLDYAMLKECWGRNLVAKGDTFKYLQLPNLSDAYVKQELPKTFVTPADEGIDPTTLIYTHTSESPIDFEIPSSCFSNYWVIGGGLAFESMQKDEANILFDSILRQVLYAASIYEPENLWKLARIWPDITSIQPGPDYKQWRVVTPNRVNPCTIIHKPIEQLHVYNSLIYTSTIDPKHYAHLTHNYIIESFTTRDKPCLRSPSTPQP